MDRKFHDLKNEFLNEIEATSAQLNQFPWSDRDAYACWLAQTYYFVSHTATFLSLSSYRFGPKDRASQNQVLRHLREEMGHEKLLLADLKSLGQEIHRFPEFPETSLFYQSQYYWLHNDHPDAHAGYSLYLEGLAAQFGDKAFTAVSEKFGPKAATFLKTHSGVDQSHFEDGLQQVANRPSEIRESILQNLKQSGFLYRCLLEKAQNTTPSFEKKSA